MTTPTTVDRVESRTGPVLDTERASAYCGIARQTLYNHRAAGTAPKAFKHGRKTVYYPADLDEWLKSRITPAPEK